MIVHYGINININKDIKSHNKQEEIFPNIPENLFNPESAGKVEDDPMILAGDILTKATDEVNKALYGEDDIDE